MSFADAYLQLLLPTSSALRHLSMFGTEVFLNILCLDIYVCSYTGGGYPQALSPPVHESTA